MVLPTEKGREVTSKKGYEGNEKDEKRMFLFCSSSFFFSLSVDEIYSPAPSTSLELLIAGDSCRRVRLARKHFVDLLTRG
jgi:hypothetical protein